jgi:hypothetical protein
MKKIAINFFAIAAVSLLGSFGNSATTHAVPVIEKKNNGAFLSFKANGVLHTATPGTVISIHKTSGNTGVISGEEKSVKETISKLSMYFFSTPNQEVKIGKVPEINGTVKGTFIFQYKNEKYTNLPKGNMHIRITQIQDGGAEKLISGSFNGELSNKDGKMMKITGGNFGIVAPMY